MARNTSKFHEVPKFILDFFTDRGFWHAVVGAFIGGVIAFSSGLMVYQLQERKQENRAVEQKIEDKKILLRGFEKNLAANLEILKLLSNPQRPDLLVNNLNLFFLQSTSQIKYQELENVELAKDIDDVAFRLNSLEQDVRSYQSLYFNPLSSTANQKFLAKAEILRRSIVEDAAAELKRTEPVFLEIEEELKKMGETPTMLN